MSFIFWEKKNCLTNKKFARAKINFTQGDPSSPLSQAWGCWETRFRLRCEACEGVRIGSISTSMEETGDSGEERGEVALLPLAFFLSLFSSLRGQTTRWPQGLPKTNKVLFLQTQCENAFRILTASVRVLERFWIKVLRRRTTTNVLLGPRLTLAVKNKFFNVYNCDLRYI